MKKAIYPGSFDPITNGHLDIVERAAKVFDKVVIVTMINPDKKGLFDTENRMRLIQESVKHLENVEVDFFNGLVVDYMKNNDIKVIVKGLRAVSDFEYEFNMALMNNKLNEEIETMFMMTDSKYSYLSSSAVKQVARFGGSISGLVPECIANEVFEKVQQNLK